TLAEVRQQFGRTYRLMIGGRVVTTEKTILSVNPADSRQVVGNCCAATPLDAERAISAAKEAFPGWRETPAEKRSDYFLRAAEIMGRRRFEPSAWEVFETGKQWREADADVAEAIDYCDYYAREMLRLSKPWRRDLPGEDNEYVYEPRG